MNSPLFRIRFWTLFFISALFASGLTAIPLQTEVDLLVKYLGDQAHTLPALSQWLTLVQTGITETNTKYPFMGLGTDWLAFGHIVIGLGFIGLLLDPVRNEWLVTWGFLACLLLLPWAWGFGELRGIPWGWRLADCSFGLGGLIPLAFIRRDISVMKQRGG